MPTTTHPIQRTVAVLLLLVVTLSVSARKLTGRVVDDATGRTIPNATVELLSIEDSSVVATAIMKSDTTWSNDIYSYYNIENVQNNTEYILRASAIGYETAYKRVSTPRRTTGMQLTSGFLSLHFSGNMGVVKTRQGYAVSLESNIDSCGCSTILGTVAGHDTIFILVKEGVEPREVEEELAGIIPEMNK